MISAKEIIRVISKYCPQELTINTSEATKEELLKYLDENAKRRTSVAFLGGRRFSKNNQGLVGMHYPAVQSLLDRADDEALERTFNRFD